MERVIVTVKRYQETRVRDLDVPAGLESAKLAEVVASALHWDQDKSGSPVKYKIKVHPPDRVLDAHETLVSAGVADGSWLTFIPQGVAAAAVIPQPISMRPAQSVGPITSWRSLGIDIPGGNTVVDDQDIPPRPTSDNPFVWREIDV